ncbi:MAG: AMP-binding protein, partial [Chloroflexota bacterium]
MSNDQTLNLIQQISQHSQFSPEKTALIFAQKFLTYRQLEEKSNQIANLLLELQVGVGDRVALLLPNCPEFIISYLGILKSGAVVVAVNSTLTQPEVSFILADSQAKVVVTTSELQDRILVDTLPDLTQVLLTDDESSSQQNLAARMAQASSLFQALEMPDEAPALILYTSGTTGTPKGAVLSFGCLAVTSGIYVQHLQLTVADKVLLCLPAFHSYGLTTTLNPTLYAGAILVMLPKFEIESVLRTIIEQEITTFYGVPTLYTLLLNQATAEQLQPVQRYISAGATLPVEIAQQWYNKFEVIVNEGYGLTEGSLTCFNQRPLDKLGSVGQPFEGIQVRVVDEQGKIVQTGQLGEVVISGPNLFLGYWNQPEATAEAIQDGWFYTGDIGRADEDGYFYIVDRRKDMVIVAGENVYPSEVENRLYHHEAVAEVAVYGIPADIFGEQVRADIILKLGHQPTEDEIIEFCRPALAPYKLPSVVKFVETLPKGKTGKILKRVLQEQANLETQISNDIATKAISHSTIKESQAVYKQTDATHIPEFWPAVDPYHVYDIFLYNRMTGDQERADKYRLAIEKTVADKVVLEIGPGQRANLTR